MKNTFWLLALVTVAAACNANDDALRCKGNTVEQYQCEDDDALGPCGWVTVDTCDVACLQTGPASDDALCVLATERDPRCIAIGGEGGICDGTEALWCRNGYVLTDDHCVSFCAKDHGVPKCDPKNYDDACLNATFACADGRLAECDPVGDGFYYKLITCGFGTACTSIPATSASTFASALCTITGDRDPRCTSDGKTVTGFCEGNVLSHCDEGYIVYVEECADDAICSWPSNNGMGACVRFTGPPTN